MLFCLLQALQTEATTANRTTIIRSHDKTAKTTLPAAKLPATTRPLQTKDPPAPETRQARPPIPDQQAQATAKTRMPKRPRPLSRRTSTMSAIPSWMAKPRSSTWPVVIIRRRTPSCNRLPERNTFSLSLPS